MGARGTTFGKLERERAKKAKAAAKRARRLERSDPSSSPDEAPDQDSSADAQDPLSAAELLALVESIHQKFEAGIIGLEEFEEKKAELLARLPID